MFHYFHGNCPGYFNTINKHVSSNRRQHKLQVPKCRTAAGRNASMGPTLRIDLPDFLALEQNIEAFKKNLEA